jgi:hypothetical protein
MPRSLLAASLTPEFSVEGTASHRKGYIHAEQQSRSASVPQRPAEKADRTAIKIADRAAHGRRTKNKTINSSGGGERVYKPPPIGFAILETLAGTDIEGSY